VNSLKRTKESLLYGILIYAITLPVSIAFAKAPQSKVIMLLQRRVVQQQQQLNDQARAIKYLEKQVKALVSNKHMPIAVEKHQHYHYKSSVRFVTFNKSNTQVHSGRHHGEYLGAKIPLNGPPNFIISGNKVLHVKLSGQVNQAAFNVDDGRRRDFYYGNNNMSDSRFKIISRVNATPDLTIGSTIEVGLRNNSSNVVSQINPTPANRLVLRIAEVSFASHHLGKVSLGQGSTASDKTAEADLSGTDVIAGSPIQKMGGSFIFRNATTGLLTGNPIIGRVINNLDGLSRRGRIRYDSPYFHGFIFSTSAIEDKHYDFALRYKHIGSHAKFVAGLGYADTQLISSIVKGHGVDGSASILFHNGLNFTVASGEVMAHALGRKNPYYYYIKLGHFADIFHVGKTAMSIDYGQFRNYSLNNDKAQTYAAAVVQNLALWKTQLFLEYRDVRLDRPFINFHHIHLVVMGARVKF